MRPQRAASARPTAFDTPRSFIPVAFTGAAAIAITRMRLKTALCRYARQETACGEGIAPCDTEDTRKGAEYRMELGFCAWRATPRCRLAAREVPATARPASRDRALTA